MRLLLVLGLSLVLACTAVAQPDDDPAPHDDPGRSFRTLSLSAGGQSSLHATPRFEEFWSTGRGGWLTVATPFFAGRADLHMAAHRYGTVDPEAPTFTGLMFTVGWSLPVDVLDRLEVAAGFRTGLYTMRFDEAREERRKSPVESEMVVAPHVQVALRVAEGWQVYASVQHLRVFVRDRLALTYSGLGVRHTFGTPNWLQTFLR